MHSPALWRTGSCIQKAAGEAPKNSSWYFRGKICVARHWLGLGYGDCDPRSCADWPGGLWDMGHSLGALLGKQHLETQVVRLSTS